MKRTDKARLRYYLNPATRSLCIAVILGILPYFTTNCRGDTLTEPYMYETPEMFISSKVLPNNLLIGENYNVVGETQPILDTKTYGFTHRFEIISTFGRFEAHSQAMVRKRINEIKAISILREITKTDPYSDALKKADKSPYRGVKDLILHSPDTVTGLPESGREFLSQSGRLKTGDDKIPSKVLDNMLIDFGKLKRGYARMLSLDPYSKNRELQRELNRISWAAFAGETGLSLLTDPIQATQGMVFIHTPFFNEIAKIVYDNTPEDLQRINRKKLKEMGVEDSLTDKFLTHPKYSPTSRTIIVHALAEMDGVKSRDQFISQAILVDEEEIAFIQQLNAEMMMLYHKNIKPLLELIPVRSFVVGYTVDQNMVATFALDLVYWTEKSDRFVSEVLALMKSPDYPAKQFIFRISGKFSDRARRVLTDNGIVLEENIERKI